MAGVMEYHLEYWSSESSILSGPDSLHQVETDTPELPYSDHLPVIEH